MKAESRNWRCVVIWLVWLLAFGVPAQERPIITTPNSREFLRPPAGDSPATMRNFLGLIGGTNLIGGGTSNYLAIWTGTNSLGSLGTNDVPHGGTGLGAVGTTGYSLVSTGSGFGFSNIVSSVTSLSNITDSGYASLVRSNLIVTGGGAGTLGLTVGANVLVVTNSNVGIGTTGLGYKLEVANTSGLTSLMRVENNDYNAVDTGTALVFTTGAASGNTYVRQQVFTAGGNGAGSLVLQNSGGNVGIGTTGPLSKLSINGGVHVGSDSDAGDNNILVDGTTTSVGDFILNTAGGKIQIKEGSNASMGIATLDGGTPARYTVTNSLVAADSRIFLTVNAYNDLFGYVAVTSRVVSTNFVITSALAGDTNQVVWHIINPAP